jgi:hypothetical protein
MKCYKNIKEDLHFYKTPGLIDSMETQKILTLGKKFYK